MKLSWFLCGELWFIVSGFVVLSEGCVMNVDFKDNSYISDSQRRGGGSNTIAQNPCISRQKN